MNGMNQILFRATWALVFWAGAWGCPIFLSAQQVQVTVGLDEDQVLSHEDCVVSVKIRNFSGRTLRLGQDNEWLRFSVTNGRDLPVERLGNPPVISEFELPSAQVATRRVNIAPFFAIGQTGAYRVSATVKFADLGIEQGSDLVGFSVVSGRLLWEQQFGYVPLGSAAGTAAELRRYSLIQHTQKNRLALFVRVSTEAEATVLKTIAVSSMTSFSKPQALIDRAGRLHVLNQFGARTAHHCIVSGECELIFRDIYDFVSSRPRLRAEDNGVVEVAGAMRRPSKAESAQPQPKETQPPRLPPVSK